MSSAAIPADAITRRSERNANTISRNGCAFDPHDVTRLDLVESTRWQLRAADRQPQRHWQTQSSALGRCIDRQCFMQPAQALGVFKHQTAKKLRALWTPPQDERQATTPVRQLRPIPTHGPYLQRLPERSRRSHQQPCEQTMDGEFT